MGEWLVELISGIPRAWQIIILAGVPFTELRFSIPAAIAMGVPPFEAYFFSILGNLLPIWPLLLLLEPVFKILSNVPVISKIIDFFERRTRNKGEKVQKYGALGLMLFVSIPLPVTGVWSGSLLAVLFGIKKIYAFLALMCGVFIAGFLVTLASVGALELITRGYGIILLVVIVLAAGAFLFRKIFSKSNSRG